MSQLFVRVIGGNEIRRDIADLPCIFSTNGTYYPLPILKQRADRFNRARCFIHHTADRSLNAVLLGWVDEVFFSEQDSSLLGVIECVGQTEYTLASAFAGVWGISWQGATTQVPYKKTGHIVVIDIDAVKTIDVVQKPAAGGAFLSEAEFNYLRGDNQK